MERIKPGDLQLQEKVVDIRRVTKVTKGGRHFSFSAIVVVGDGNGVVGDGMGKANQVNDAVTKAIDEAKKKLVRISIIKETIPHTQEAKYCSSKVLLKPASQGTGVIAGGAMRAVLESAGIKNILAKSKGSSNPHNVIKATIKALALIRTPHEIAVTRGIPMEKVFNG